MIRNLVGCNIVHCSKPCPGIQYQSDVTAPGVPCLGLHVLLECLTDRIHATVDHQACATSKEHHTMAAVYVSPKSKNSAEASQSHEYIPIAHTLLTPGCSFGRTDRGDCWLCKRYTWMYVLAHTMLTNSVLIELP